MAHPIRRAGSGASRGAACRQARCRKSSQPLSPPGKRNLLVRKVGEKWTVAAVLDWEFAVAGSPLVDVGHFLRYETFSRPRVEPHFSNGYVEAGGRLGEGWRRLARVIDLVALCESLTHDALPDPVVAELSELVTATIEDRDPEF